MNKEIDILELEAGALSDNTRAVYLKGWNLYLNFRKEKNIKGSPLDLSEQRACEFLAWLCTPNGHSLSVASAMLFRQGLSRKLKEQGKPDPFQSIRLKNVRKGLLRKFGKAPRRVRALRENEILAMVVECGKSKIGRRDAAILAVGFSCALRRSEICGLAREDVKINDDFSMNILIRKSKTDKARKGQRVSVPPGKSIRPGATLYKWLTLSGIEDGPVFQTMKRGGGLRGLPMHHSDIPRLVKHYAALIGLDPKEVSGHSLRAGFVTSAAAHGARLDKIMEVTRHTQPQTVMSYIRDENQLQDHAGDAFL